MFVGELTLAAAHAVGDAEDDREALTQAIADLGDKSLIQVSSVQGSAENRLLDTTRAYASYKLAERGEKDEIAAGPCPVFLVRSRANSGSIPIYNCVKFIVGPVFVNHRITEMVIKAD